MITKTTKSNQKLKIPTTTINSNQYGYAMSHIMLIYYKHHNSPMSDREDELSDAQKKQNKVGEAGSNPETSGPAENLRDKAAKMTDKNQDSEEPS
jgi:hypothetical protein